ncbi:hypothetical protein [Streptomyces sp. NPDC014764]|uniref:hypothetical protein n=1 Tax=Streptomyces sp. NPDC014764 TaxID=3364907 RepID=UPI0036FCE81A
MDDLTTHDQADKVLAEGTTNLRAMLGEDWEVSIQPEAASPQGGDTGWDAVIRLASRHDSIFTELLVEARTKLTPKDVAGHISSKAQLVRRINRHTRLMVFAPWISPKTQEELQRREIDYLDLTGNVSLRVTRPAIIIRTLGADRAPAGHRAPSSKPMLTGPAAGRLVRLLADVRPPYRATDLAKSAQLSVPYVSKLLDALEDQLLIGRDNKVIAHVDWQALLRTRAGALDLAHHSNPVGMLAPMGIQPVIEQLVQADGFAAGSEILVTGSYAARPVAPIAVGGQLMIYATRHDDASMTRLAQELGLMPVPEAADVLILAPWDLSVLHRPARLDRYWQVGLSQLVLDCLSGPGRMPAEGEKVLEFMAANEDIWRLDDLGQAGRHRTIDPGTRPQKLF